MPEYVGIEEVGAWKRAEVATVVRWKTTESWRDVGTWKEAEDAKWWRRP